MTLWCAFLVHVMNEEKLTSSVFRQVMYVLRTSPKVEEILGEGIRLESTWWTGGDPYIEGAVSLSIFALLSWWDARPWSRRGAMDEGELGSSPSS